MGRRTNYELDFYKQFEELNKKLDCLLKENKELNNTINELNNTNKELYKKLDEANKLNEKLQNEIDRLKNKNNKNNKNSTNSSKPSSTNFTTPKKKLVRTYIIIELKLIIKLVANMDMMVII